MRWRQRETGAGCRSRKVAREVRAWDREHGCWGTTTLYDHVTEHEFPHLVGPCYCGRQTRR